MLNKIFSNKALHPIARQRRAPGELFVGHEMNNNSAKINIIGQRFKEEPFQINIEVGVPHQCCSDPEEWAWSVSLKPLYNNLNDAHGGDSLQALCLALSLALDLLHGFKEKGGVLRFTSGEEFPLEA